MTLPEPVVGRARETAVSVVVPEAEAPTFEFRARFLQRAIARRIPAHITLPLKCVASSIALLAEPADGTWSERAALRLAGER